MRSVPDVSIDIANESGGRATRTPRRSSRVRLTGWLRIHPMAELSLVLVDEDAMSLLHERWMDETGPTDVLSFPMDELPPHEQDSGEPGLLVTW